MCKTENTGASWGIGVKGSFDVKLQDGRWIRTTDRPMAGGGFVSVHSDITQNKEIERRNRLNEQRFKDFTSVSSDWFWEMDEHLRFSHFSDRFEEITTVSPQFLLGKTRQESEVTGVDPVEWAQHLDDLDAHRVFHDFVHPRFRPDGSHVWLSLSGKPVFDEKRTFLGYRGIGKDITERKAAEKKALAAQDQLNDAMSSISEGFCLYDADDRLVVCNDRYRDIYSASAEAIVPGALFEDIIRYGAERGQYSEAEGRVEDFIKERVDKHQNATGVIEQLLGDGRWLRIEERKTQRGGVVGIRTDITELKRAEQAAVDANRAKSEFLASMSHEIRTPITGVMGFADMLLDDDLPEESRHKVVQVKESISSLLSLLNEILDLSKLEAGKMEIENIDFHLPSLIEETESLFANNIKSKGLELKTFMADSVPEAIHSDPTRIRQVLLNLIGNAVKFTEKGSIQVDVRWGLPDEKGDRLHFAVSDSGIGIHLTPELNNRMFSKFTQADASISRKYHGSGLGLSICRRLVELMGGDIGVESQLSEGSTFWFSLPYTPASSPVDKIGFIDKSIEYEASRSLNILVADDVSINRRAIRAAMEKYGHVITVAQDGVQAVQAHERGEFDLILMDVRMPELSGHDATRLIRQLPGEKGRIPIIALTADAMEENRKECLTAGMNEMATKPIDRPVLLAAINTVMGEEIHVAADKSESAPKPASADRDDPGELEDSPVLDLKYLDDIFQDPEIIPELLEDFIKSTEPLVDDIIKSLACEDLEKARDAAHAAKGASRMAGATRLGDICEEIQFSLKNDDYQAAQPCLEQLRPAFAEVRQIVEEMVANREALR